MIGQVSNEAIIMIGFILLVFTAISVDVIQKQITIDEIDEGFENRNVCLSVSGSINSLYILGPGSESTIEIQKEVIFYDGNMKVGDFFCNTCCNITNGTVSRFNLTKGHAKISYIKDLVIENV